MSQNILIIWFHIGLLTQLLWKYLFKLRSIQSHLVCIKHIKSFSKLDLDFNYQSCIDSLPFKLESLLICLRWRYGHLTRNKFILNLTNQSLFKIYIYSKLTYFITTKFVSYNNSDSSKAKRKEQTLYLLSYFFHSVKQKENLWFLFVSFRHFWGYQMK